MHRVNAYGDNGLILYGQRRLLLEATGSRAFGYITNHMPDVSSATLFQAVSRMHYDWVLLNHPPTYRYNLQ